MLIFRCKMCGGNIEFEQGATVGICDSCGTKQTLPRLADDRRANLYDRANHFRRNNDFDKATGIYEQILNEDNTDAEAYWSLVLCRYGIEYVEDPGTHRRVPTVNRAQFQSIYDDDNYKSALEYADGYQRVLYEEEATVINEIQKGILSISQKEEPFDVFICYKETDANGRRTQDSVLANDLYHQLTQEGFKVFFSRITLEDKLGTAYEPYIFAALNSAKVMVVLGTKPEYFNAVWVKNEWSRYLALVNQSGGKKVLIPAYRDMDPYDLPDEFSHLQAQDMSKLGFMQDLIRGIKKIVDSSTTKKLFVESVGRGESNNVDQLLRRAFVSLEYGEWDEANKVIDKVLDTSPENAQAYLARLMAEMHVRKQEELANCTSSFAENSNYKRAIRFGDPELKDSLKECLNKVEDYEELARKKQVYNEAMAIRQNIHTTEDVKRALAMFESLDGFQNADVCVVWCRKVLQKSQQLDNTYNEAVREEKSFREFMNHYNRQTSTIEEVAAAEKTFHSAIDSFSQIETWRDSKERIEQLRLLSADLSSITQEKKQQYLLQEKTEQKKQRKTIGIALIVIGIVLAGSGVNLGGLLIFVGIIFIVLSK